MAFILGLKMPKFLPTIGRRGWKDVQKGFRQFQDNATKVLTFHVGILDLVQYHVVDF